MTVHARVSSCATCEQVREATWRAEVNAASADLFRLGERAYRSPRAVCAVWRDLGPLFPGGRVA